MFGISPSAAPSPIFLRPPRRALGLAAILLSLLAAASPARAAQAETPDAALAKAIAGPQRNPAFRARDAARHPAEELAFFGLKPTMTVVEIWPTGGYWTEILAPYLHDRGAYYAAVPVPANPEAANKALEMFKAKLAENPSIYDKVKITEFVKGHDDIAPAGSADLVLTFRNLHNWLEYGDWADEAFADFFKALKPGGILGIEDHRASDKIPQDPTAKNGYVRQDYTIALAKKAGFEFVGSSEINANPKDTKDWEKGVWTLPPSFALKDVDHAKYEAIGEADNFVLKFRKPLK